MPSSIVEEGIYQAALADLAQITMNKGFEESLPR